jgi:hypothetical protein
MVIYKVGAKVVFWFVKMGKILRGPLMYGVGCTM